MLPDGKIRPNAILTFGSFSYKLDLAGTNRSKICGLYEEGETSDEN